MIEPAIFGLPLSEAFFYFILYSVLGWALETVYCSVVERHLVSRGFLYGPICPIYGVGVLMMICWFRPFVDRPVLFFLVATLCMSAWEYFVGWLLETVTHIKYWDYSMFRFHLNGRICLWVCLMWGVLSYLVLYWLHPQAERLFRQLAGSRLFFADGFFLGALLFDMTATVYQLARTSRMLKKIQQTGEELLHQLEQGRHELGDKLAEAGVSLSRRLDDLIPDQADDAVKAAKARYDQLVSNAEVLTRRFRSAFGTMHSSGPAAEALEAVKRRGELVKKLWREGKERGRQDRSAKK